MGDKLRGAVPMDAVIGEAVAGSESAWHKIVEVLGPSIRGFARARGVSEPGELTQDVFLDAARNIRGFHGDWAGFRSWIFTIAYRRVADHHRRNARRPQLVSDDTAAQRVEGGRRPDEALVQRETVDQLLGALHNLSQIERDVVLLRIIGELSSDEVAEVVGKTPGNVRVIQNRALTRMRKNLEKNV